MNDTETRLRAALHDLADEVAPAPLLERLQRNHRSAVRRRRLTLTAVAAATVAAVAAGSLVVLRLDQSRVNQPVVRPPKVFGLSEVTSWSPGASSVAVTLASIGGADGTSTHLLPAGSDDTVRLPTSDLVPSAWTESLSGDGTRYVRQNDSYSNPFIEITDLRSGRRDDLGGVKGFCPELSPDNRTVAIFSDPGVKLIDVRTRASRNLVSLTRSYTRAEGGFPQQSEACSGGLGWSPDGRLLVIRGAVDTRVVDTAGDVVLRVPSAYPANGSMSWAPDGRSVILYDRDQGRFMVVDVADGATADLPPPPAGVRPLGWAGMRVVWLAGDYGEQSLVTVEPDGTDPRTWMRFDVGGRPVEAVQWSRHLSGYGTE